jgi:hypothetical protein
LSQDVSIKYGLFNDSTQKPLVYVLKIEGLPFVFGSGTVFKNVKYGDEDLNYGVTYNGLPVVYGGLIPFGGFDGDGQRPYLNLDKGGMTVSQKAEPWEGKASVSTLDFTLTDVNEEVLQVISPGIVLDEILLKRVEFFVGFDTIGFPEDFIRLYRGIVSAVDYEPGLITIKTSDPNLLRRQKLFEKAQTNLTAAINASQTTIPVESVESFYSKINRGGSTSPELFHTVGIKVGDELMLLTANPSGNSFTVSRGGYGTTATSHANDSEVTVVFSMTGNPLIIALKLMLSGWGGQPSVTGVPVSSFLNTGDPANPNEPYAVIFNEDMRDVYGLEPGDLMITTGATNGDNNFGERPIVSFFNVAGLPNRGIVVESDSFFGPPLVSEGPTAAVASFRSQFDVYPEECGLKMRMTDVDVARHVQITNEFLTTDVANFSFVITSEEATGKDFIEKQLYLPAGAYSLTRSGRCSVVVTAPPLPIYSLIDLTPDNVIDADKARMSRGVNTRKFYNQIDYSYNENVEGEFETFEKYIDSDSLERIPYKEVLEIESRGMRTGLNADALIDRTTRRLFERYSFAAQTITFKVNWQVGAILEAGDIVLITDNGGLKFPDLNAGTRGLQPQLWEVMEKSTDLKTGVSTLTIINGVGANVTDRFGVIAPSSEIVGGVSTTQFRLATESFGAYFPGQEYRKWENYIGLKVRVFKPDFSQEAETTLISFDDADEFLVNVDPPLSFTPAAGDIMDLAMYSSSADKNDQGVAKAIHAYLSPIVEVVSGISATQFTVSAPNAAKFWVGGVVVVHSADYTVLSPEVLVTTISSNTITVEALGFTPTAGQRVTFIGFSADETQTFRWYG